MASVIQRPTDTFTEDHLMIGMPFVDFALLLSGGTFGPFRNIGIVENAEFAKELGFTPLRSAQSGVDVLVRELVASFDATLNVGVFNFDEDNMRLFFASEGLTAIAASTPAVADDPFNLTDDNRDFLDLAQPNIVETITSVVAGQITDEIVGTVTAALGGEVLGDFSLDFKPAAAADVTSIKVSNPDGTVVDYSATGAGDIVDLGAPAGLYVEVEDHTDNTGSAGRLAFGTGGVPVALTTGATITATYKPVHAVVENTDFVVDYIQGRVRMLAPQFDPATETPTNALEYKKFQPMEANYTHTVVEHHEIQPFTQFVFPGKARIRLLTNNGINIIWIVPSAQVRLTDDAFAFSRDSFSIGDLAIQLLDNGGTAPFGTLETYPET